MRYCFALITSLSLLAVVGCHCHNTCDCCPDICSSCCDSSYYSPHAAPAKGPKPEEIKQLPEPKKEAGPGGKVGMVIR